MTRRSCVLFFLIWALVAAPSGAALHIDLDDDWRFRTDPANLGEQEDWARTLPDGTRPVTVPHSWNIGLDHDFDGTGWYFRTLTVPRGLTEGSKVELHFGATFYRSRVWLNGEPVGGHEGGYTEYAIDVTKHLHPGENRLAVAIDNRPGFATIPGYAMRQAPTGNVWYDWWRNGGIVRDVWMTIAEGGLIRRQRVASVLAPDKAVLTDDVFVENIAASPRDYRLAVTALAPDGKNAGTVERPLTLAAGEKRSLKLALEIARPQLWNVGAARLYRITAELRAADGTLLDSHQDSIGLRQVVIRDRHLLVNGRPVRLSGMTRHEDSPWEGLAETRGTIRQDWQDMARLHTTLTRPVHYPQTPAVFDAADRAGILLIPEIPLWQFSEAQLQDPRVLALAEQMMREMIEQAGNHPSIFAWSVCNESDAAKPGGLAYIRAMKHWINQIDPGRLVSFADADVAVKPWRDEAALHEVDFIMANAYFGSWSGAAQDVEPWLDFVGRTYPDKMVIISEFGWPGPFSRDAVRADKDRADNLVAQMAAFERRDFIGGAIFWTYQDYKSNRNLPAGQVEGYVDHGLVDQFRQRKPSYDVWEKRNRAVAVTAGWRVGDHGAEGFHATMQRASILTLPSYPLIDYRAHWRVTDDRGTVLGEGERALPDLDQPVSIEDHWTADAKAGGVTLALDVLTPDDVVAGGVHLDFAPLRLGGAPFPPDAAELPR